MKGSAKIKDRSPKIFPVRRRHPDDTFFEKIDVEYIERYKTSGLSGDEWRFSWRVRCGRKGRVLAERWCNSRELAVALAGTAMALGWELLEFHAEGWEILETWNVDVEKGTCCQPGCPKKATVRYKIKREYDSTCFFSKDLESDQLWYREFCDNHAERGNCGLDDGESNYERIDLP